MQELLRRDIDGRTAVAAVTECSDGDVHPEDVRQAVVPPGGDVGTGAQRTAGVPRKDQRREQQAEQDMQHQQQ